MTPQSAIRIPMCAFQIFPLIFDILFVGLFNFDGCYQNMQYQITFLVLILAPLKDYNLHDF